MPSLAPRLAVLATALAAATVAADTVHLRNGDRITGAIQTKEGDVLTVRTEYAGTVKIRWQDVAEIRADEPITVLLQDDTRTQVTGIGGAAPLPPERVAFVNPTPGQAGTGMDYGGRVTLAATVTGGNTDTERYYGEGEFRGRSRERRFSLRGNLTESTDRGATTASNWLLGGDHDWFIRPREFVYVRASFEHDEFRDVDLRSAAGVGYGYQLIDTPDTRLSVQAGPDYVIQDRITGEDEESIALGWGIRYAQWLLDRRAQAFHDQDGFHGISETGTLVRTRTGLRVPLTNGLNMTAQLNLDWNSDPAPGREDTDTTWLLGLGYAW